MITRLIVANCLVYLGLKSLWLAAPWLGVDFEAAAARLLLPPSFAGVGERPWTLLTYMFTQCDFRHLLVNMLWLGGFGSVTGRLVGGMRVLALYLAGGLAGALMYLLCGLTPFAPSGPLAGASASVIALTLAAGALAPGLRTRLAYLGSLPLRHVVPVALLAFFFCSLPEAMAHVGGLLAGVCAAWVWRRGIVCRGGPAGGPELPVDDAMDAEAAEYRALVGKANALGYEALLPAEQRRLYELTSRRPPRAAAR